MQAFKFWSGEWQRAITGITGYNKAFVSLEPSPILLGVGYIIGPRIASVMVGGGILTALFLVPMIAYFGDGLPAVLAAGPAADSRVEQPARSPASTSATSAPGRWPPAAS